MQTIVEAVKSIETAKADAEVRVLRRIEIGHGVQQGDVYLWRVEKKHAKGKIIGEGDVQVALGTGNGARHMAVGKLKVYQGKLLPAWVRPMEGVEPSIITGPVIVAEESWNLAHPEHAAHVLPAGTWQVTYQFDPRTMQRVMD